MSAPSTIRLPEDIIRRVRVVGKVEHRKPAQKIEYWISLARCAIDNPDLSIQRAAKKLHANDRKALDRVVRKIAGTPEKGDAKK